MIIVSVKLTVQPGSRDSFIAESRAVVEQARQTAGCGDFAVSADSVDANRVNIYEAWESVEALRAFRGEGPGDDLSALILSADVREFDATPTGL